eukprot:m.174645 g.174645  ORF g.174645 m.174645 type:complete len:404 (+) comp31777_c0_seq1:187-1398(+)
MARSSVGLANLPDRLHDFCAGDVFDFTLMVVGESGLGKSTFVNSFFATDIFDGTNYPLSAPRIPQTHSVVKRTVELEENGVHLRLTVVDTPGFGNALDNSNCWEPALKYIEKGYTHFMNGESRVVMSKFCDERVHCCLYFLAPTSRGLKPLDIAALKQLQEMVTIIPIIGRADMLSDSERVAFRTKILADLKNHGIKTYDFPIDADDVTDEGAGGHASSAPYFISSSLQVETNKGEINRLRAYPWGTLQTSDPGHSDFSILRQRLIGTFMYDLIDTTHRDLYESFRTKMLLRLELAAQGSLDAATPMAQFESLRRQEEEKLKAMEENMEQMFLKTMAEKEDQLSGLEKRLLQEHEDLESDLQNLKSELDNITTKFEEEKNAAASLPPPPPVSSRRSKGFFKTT